jgi:hypothetical protein
VEFWVRAEEKRQKDAAIPIGSSGGNGAKGMAALATTTKVKNRPTLTGHDFTQIREP